MRLNVPWCRHSACQIQRLWMSLEKLAGLEKMIRLLCPPVQLHSQRWATHKNRNLHWRKKEKNLPLQSPHNSAVDQPASPVAEYSPSQQPSTLR